MAPSPAELETYWQLQSVVFEARRQVEAAERDLMRAEHALVMYTRVEHPHERFLVLRPQPIEAAALACAPTLRPCA